MKESYAAAGVNTDTSARIKKLIANIAKTTSRPEVLSGVGFLAGCTNSKVIINLFLFRVLTVRYQD